MKAQQLAGLFTAMCVTLLAARAAAQTGASAIAGVAKDASGAILPGVSVEASSPALIEKTRTVITDSQGQYKIVDLRPGTYVVTFTLPGFSTVKRQGVELPANFTATINADMAVGALEETVTVSGETPVVDVQNTAMRNVISAKELDAVPTSKSFISYTVLTVGISAVGNSPTAPGAQPQDVGGSKGDTMVFLVYHGSNLNDAKVTQDGFETNFTGGSRLFIPNPYGAQETSLDLGGGTAEHRSGGVQLNIIPKSGGNRYNGDVFGTYANEHFQGNNATPELDARGLTASTINRLNYLWDFNASVGGPIKVDKLWFYGGDRQWGGSNFVAGLYYNQTPGTLAYTPDPNRPGENDFRSRSGTVRLTWQATAKNKFTGSYDWQHRCDCHRDITALTSPEAVNYRIYSPVSVLQTTWTYPASNKLLYAGGVQAIWQNLNVNPQPELPPTGIPITEDTTGFTYGAMTGTYGTTATNNVQTRFSVSYVTGSHALKGGLDSITEWSNANSYSLQNLSYTFHNGLPVSLIQYALPNTVLRNTTPDLGLFAQDQWTFRRVTMNLGVRFDYLNVTVPAQDQPPVQFRPTGTSFPSVDCANCSKDLSPRVGISWDLFGTGKTAVKASLGRYVISRAAQQGSGAAFLPAGLIVTSAGRSWTDANGNFSPNCDLANIAQQDLRASGGDFCGALNNSQFGQQNVNTVIADDVRNDYRRYTWVGGVSVQQELVPGVALTAGYYRTSWSDFTVTNNTLATAADFNPYCVPVPVDSRLPGGGGNQLCGLYNIKPALFGKVSNVVSRTSKWGTQTDVYNGFEVTASARLAHGISLSGGTSTGREAHDNCFAANEPELSVAGYMVNNNATNVIANNPAGFCKVVQPFMTQVKVQGVVPLPWDLQASGTFQSLPGIQNTASLVVSNALIAPSLGRPLSGNASSVNVGNIVAPYTKFEDRSTQVDLRLTKVFKLSDRMSLRGNFDLYNVFNASPVLAVNTVYGPNWLKPTLILDARLFKLSAQLTF